ncbi:MAG TPA: hypothetical protein VNF74_06690 [Terriglobales bacterium]|nr:hypothetical protein [Terriglobales bacterium]
MRRRILFCAALLALAAGAQIPQSTLLFTHARLLDGSGNPWRWADVAVAGDRIIFVGDAARAGFHAAGTLDLHGLYLAPGFIDLHTHTAAGLS